METASGIADFFSGQGVFVTGVTGFLGKVILEKILRSCPDVKSIFVLIRSKKGLETRERLQRILNEKLYNRVRKECPEAFSKIVVVNGDITLPSLGISKTDREKVIKEVSIVIHSAATVRFDEPLRRAVEMNVCGTKKVLDLCHQLNTIKVMVHVSTAYANCNLKEIKEVVYPTPIHPSHITDITQWMDDTLLDHITPRLLMDRPNTYTYSKAMAEIIIQEEAKVLPVVIVRPSIVTSSWREPVPGWIDNFNGPTGLMVALATGILKSIYNRPDLATDFIPVDVVSNCILAAAWYRGTSRTTRLNVFNCTSGAVKKMTWGDFDNFAHPFIFQYPSVNTLRYPSISVTDIKAMHQIRMFLQHYIPAQFGDMLLRCIGKKPVLIRLYNQITSSMDTYEYFSTHEWDFQSDNTQFLHKELTEKDKEEFNFNLETLNWRDYLENYSLGAREFLLKEDLSTLPRARQYLRVLYVVNHVINVVLAVGAWKLLSAFNIDMVDMLSQAGSLIYSFVF